MPMTDVLGILMALGLIAYLLAVLLISFLHAGRVSMQAVESEAVEDNSPTYHAIPTLN